MTESVLLRISAQATRMKQEEAIRHDSNLGDKLTKAMFAGRQLYKQNPEEISWAGKIGQQWLSKLSKTNNNSTNQCTALGQHYERLN